MVLAALCHLLVRVGVLSLTIARVDLRKTLRTAPMLLLLRIRSVLWTAGEDLALLIHSDRSDLVVDEFLLELLQIIVQLLLVLIVPYSDLWRRTLISQVIRALPYLPYLIIIWV